MSGKKSAPGLMGDPSHWQDAIATWNDPSSFDQLLRDEQGRPRLSLAALMLGYSPEQCGPPPVPVETMLVMEVLLARDAANRDEALAAETGKGQRPRGRPPLNGKLDRDEQRAYVVIGMNVGLPEPKSTRDWIRELQAEEEAGGVEPSKRLFPKASAVEQLEQSVSRGLKKLAQRQVHPRGDFQQRYMRPRRASKFAKKSR